MPWAWAMALVFEVCGFAVGLVYLCLFACLVLLLLLVFGFLGLVFGVFVRLLV